MIAALLLFAVALQAQMPDVVFLEPIDRKAKPLPTFRMVSSEQYLPWTENEFARRAFRLYAQAFELLELAGNPQRQPKSYYIALVPGGNHAEIGFRIENGNGGRDDHPNHSYILLAPDRQSFESTLLHETGHVAMSMLLGGKQLPRSDVTSIPHSTAMLSDRATAFAEGWAIHLETLAAHLTTDAAQRRKYHRAGVTFGGDFYVRDEYFRPATDLTSYAQNVSRYVDVRENIFAFDTAFKGPDYLRVQLEKSRDFASLRNPNQLLASEGFHASFFFLFLIRGDQAPSETVIAARHKRMLGAMQSMGRRVKMEPGVPWLIEFLTDYIQLFPDEKAEVIGAFHDLTHGVFVDPEAAALWRKHYLAALKLDLGALSINPIRETRKRWLDAVAADVSVLRSRLGPEVPCHVSKVQVKIEAFGDAEPLLFDINTAPEGILRLVPGLPEKSIERWLSVREKKPFASLDELRKEVGPVCDSGGSAP